MCVKTFRCIISRELCVPRPELLRCGRRVARCRDSNKSSNEWNDRDLEVDGIGVAMSITEDYVPVVGFAEISQIGVKMYLRGNHYDSPGKAARTRASEIKNRSPLKTCLYVAKSEDIGVTYTLSAMLRGNEWV